MASREKYEQQPFITYTQNATVVPVNPHDTGQRRPVRRRRPRCAVCCCLALIFLVVLIFPITLVFYIWIWPNQCFYVLDDSAPIQLGINMQQSRIFVVFTKPLQLGPINSSLNLCGDPTSFDTTFFPVFGGLKVTAANFTLKTHRCQNLPPGADANQPQGTLKFIIDGNSNETRVTIDDVNVVFTPLDLPKHGYFELFSNGENVKTTTPTKGVVVDFLQDGAVSFHPPIGVVYSKFQAISSSEILILAANSPNNHCGAPAIGVTLDAGIFRKAWQAFKHWVNYSFPDLSPIGISQIYALTQLQLSELGFFTNPVLFTANTHTEPKMPVYLKKGRIQVEESSVTLTNLSLSIGGSGKRDHDVHLRSLARLKIQVPLGDIEAVAALKKRLQIVTSFRDAQFELPFDIDISSNNRKTNGESLSGFSQKELLAKVANESAGWFQMKNMTILSPDNSSIFTPSLTGIVEPIYVRSSRQISSTIQCQAMLYKYLTMDFVTAAMTVPAGQALKVQILGNGPDSTPLTVNLYQLGRVANNMKMIISTTCLDEKPPENKSQEKRHHVPRSEALLTPGGSYSYNYTIDLENSEEPPVEDDGGMKLESYTFDAREVDARVIPIENFVTIDKIYIGLNATGLKPALDLQVGLKQSPEPWKASL